MLPGSDLCLWEASLSSRNCSFLHPGGYSGLSHLIHLFVEGRSLCRQPQLKHQGHFVQGLDILVQRGNIMDRLLLFALEEEVLQSLLLLEEVSYWL